MKWLRGKMQKSMALAAAVSLCVFAAGTDCLEPSAAEAASIDFSSRGSITVTLYSEETGSLVTDGALTLYQVASLYLDDGSMAYELTEGFQYFEGDLDVESASLGSELAEYVEAYSGRETEDGDTFIIEGTEQSVGNDGTAEFTDLDLGLYLVVQTVPSTGYYVIDPFVVTIPYDFSGTWVYDVDASPKTEINPQPETETETEPQTETETEPQTETETEQQTETEPPPETDPETEAQTEPETEPQSEPETEAQTEPETEPQSDPETEPQSEPETESQSDPETEPQTETETETESETETENETEVETESESETETEPQTQTEPPTQTESETESETEPKLPQTGQLNWPIPMLAAGGLVLIALGILLARPKNKGNR